MLSGRFTLRWLGFIEIVLEAGEAFDLVDAAIGERPGAHDIASARDSLQVRARIKRCNPYPG